MRRCPSVSLAVSLVLPLSIREACAEPFRFPLANGFPFPNDTALEDLFSKAGGNFSNAPLAPKFDDDSLTSWKLQAFNEFMEVAFFTQLIANITGGVTGYEIEASSEEYILSSLRAIQAQEEMHAYNANDAVRYFTNGTHILPCTYQFPVSDFSSAIAFAQMFTDMYIGLLANIQQRTAKNLAADSNSIIYVLAQALGQEGQQSGWFRSLQKKPPSAEPFLTSSTRELAFSWLQSFVVPGSCPTLGDIPLRIIPPLQVLAVEDAKDGNRRVTLLASGQVDPVVHSVAFVNGALVPTVVRFEVVKDNELLELRHEGGVRTMREDSSQHLLSNLESAKIIVNLPFTRNVMHGMIIATIVSNGETFITAEDITNATIYGPAVIELA